MATYKTITSVSTAIDILGFVADQREAVSGAEIATASNLNYNTAMCHIETLKQAGYIEPAGEGFVLGMAAAKLWSRKKAALSGSINRASAQLNDLGGE